MPYLRFSRDTRGYEHTYLIAEPRKRGARKRPRVLYWFRTPPSVKVGRAAIDEEAIRDIERHNPDVAFDWSTILQARPPAPPPDPDQRRRPMRGQRRPADSSEPEAAPPTSRVAPAGSESRRPDSRPAPPDQPAVAPAPAPPAPPPQADWGEPMAATALVDGDGNLTSQPGVLPDPPERATMHVLDPEDLGRLRARHAEVLARISERITDAVRLEQLRAEAEKLNPDSWVTETEVRDGLGQFERVLEGLRRVIGQRRRRPRRGGARRSRPQPGHVPPSVPPTGDAGGNPSPTSEASAALPPADRDDSDSDA